MTKTRMCSEQPQALSPTISGQLSAEGRADLPPQMWGRGWGQSQVIPSSHSLPASQQSPGTPSQI